MSSRFYSGWGIRTVASTEARYNPMSYHNGSVWPHDNALIALGFARYGHKIEVGTVFAGLVEAASYDELDRLPELFCGFSRRPKRGPTSYPVACSPQAWAAAAPYALIAAATGLSIDPVNGVAKCQGPTLPSFLDTLSLSGMVAGWRSIDVRIERSGTTKAVTVRQRAKIGRSRYLTGS